jgi:tRNA (guanine-N7-)-methyltransferase
MSSKFRFRDRPTEEFKDPDLNPYLKLHREFGPPVFTAEDAQKHAGRWQTAFDREAPIHLEIGTGNGFFLAEMAQRHPDWNWLGLEIRYKRVILTAKKLRAAGAATHARVARYDAHCIDELFAAGELSGVYVNHPDPWSKDRHANNRLFNKAFFERIASTLKPGGDFRLKTDHLLHVETVCELTDNPTWHLVGRSDHIARDGAPWEKDVTTNYQRKFNERSLPVYGLWLRRTPASNS